MLEDNYEVEELRCDEHMGSSYDYWKGCSICQLKLDMYLCFQVI
jgi:Pyruvate/2-oxoacid:ferredoxin oxidoreductase delta subunit